MTAQRIDSNGFIEIENNPLSKVGVFDYWGSEIDAPDKSKLYKVYRPAEELSSSACMDSFKGMPLVDNHTMLGNGATDPATKGIDGTIGDKVYFKDGTLFGNLRLYTNKIKNLVKNGKRDLSLGYYSRYEFTPGVWNGQAYDAIQRYISGNHVALVDAGRMGQSVAVLDQQSQHNLTITFDQKAIEMTIETEALAEIVNAALAPLIKTMDEQSKKIDEQAQALTAIKKTMDEAEAESEEKDDEKKEDETDDKEVEADEKKATEDAAAKVAALVIATQDAAVKQILLKDELVKIASPLVGTFDHSAMTAEQVAKYAADKLNLSGDPETALRTYAKVIGTKQTVTLDNAPADKTVIKIKDFN